MPDPVELVPAQLVDAGGSVYDVETAPAQRRSARRRVADWGGDELFAHVPRRRFARGHAGSSAGSAADRGRVHEASRAAPAPTRSGSSAPHRRTIVVTGHPGEREPARDLRSRPRRGGWDRTLHGRPDRIAAWAVGLGSLLILIAVSTADAAVQAI